MLQLLADAKQSVKRNYFDYNGSVDTLILKALQRTMASVNVLFAAFFMATFSIFVNAGLLDYVYPALMTEFFSQVPTKEGYRFNLEEPNGSKREEIGIIMNPDTPDEQLVIMGMYTVYDEKTDTETVTMYTADKDGYKPRYMLKNRKISAKALMSSAG